MTTDPAASIDKRALETYLEGVNRTLGCKYTAYVAGLSTVRLQQESTWKGGST